MKRGFRMLMAALCSVVFLCGFSVTAYAGGGDEYMDYETEPVVETEPATEPEPAPTIEPGAGFAEEGNVWVRPDEMEAIQGRMAEAGISNLSAYVRKMALNGYVLHVDLSDIRELVSLQRRCANNLNQVAIQANTYGGIYPEEIAQLQKDYAALWEPLSDLLKKLSAVTAL